MIAELIIRFVAGGLFVCVFAVIGDMVQPKTFAGIFGAAPSVALATLAIKFMTKGNSIVALESRSLLAGAVALAAYGLVTAILLLRYRVPAIPGSVGSWAIWLGVAFGLWGLFLR